MLVGLIDVQSLLKIIDGFGKVSQSLIGLGGIKHGIGHYTSFLCSKIIFLIELYIYIYLLFFELYIYIYIYIYTFLCNNNDYIHFTSINRHQTQGAILSLPWHGTREPRYCGRSVEACVCKPEIEGEG